MELISQAASNSLFIFCFCNLIIFIILGSSKPFSKASQQVKSRNTNNKGSERAKQTNAANNAFMEDSEEPNSLKALSAGDKGNNDNDNDESGDEDYGDDDELRQRVEEFIEKVNEGWKAEVLGSLKAAT
ncbi:hypothetical protein FNV43_RR24211 [Rhamnella rubrinervis]|uniref:Uncharacterized protein n=1 Tax=Rhamnella rubrinervis TaxID=2594499 RepID=A0A8K0DRU0_9ROSA|nr:hypothetical protein FNV43_RR24211 [Rhamnella rubrinervis]